MQTFSTRCEIQPVVDVADPKTGEFIGRYPTCRRCQRPPTSFEGITKADLSKPGAKQRLEQEQKVCFVGEDGCPIRKRR